MKIIFIGSPYDVSDPKRSQSVAFYIVEALRDAGAEVIKFTPKRSNYDKLYKIIKILFKIVGKNYIYFLGKMVLKDLAKEINDFLKKTEHDHVMAFGSMAFPYVHTEKPYSFWSDATIYSLKNYHQFFKKLSVFQLKKIKKLERDIIDDSSNVFLASEYATQIAIEYFRENKSKIKFLPFGANLPEFPYKNEVVKNIENKLNEELELVWIAKEWDSKGGNELIELAKILKVKGIKFKINCIGVREEVPKELTKNFHFHGPLKKNVHSDFNKMKDILSRSHFLVLLTRSEAFGHVFAEASAFGLPSIATRTGGVPSAVNEGLNGFLFNEDEDANTIANKILEVFNDKILYKELSISSYEFHEINLNWIVNAKKVLEEINN